MSSGTIADIAAITLITCYMIDVSWRIASWAFGPLRRPAPAAAAGKTAAEPADQSPALRPDEIEMVRAVAQRVAEQPHTDVVTGEGRRIADFMRRRFPQASDASITRMVVVWLFIAGRLLEDTDDVTSAWGAMYESMQAALLDLTALERTDAP